MVSDRHAARVQRDIGGTIALAIAWLSLLAASSLAFFKVALTSDALFLEDLAHDLFTDGGSWSDWSLTPAPAFLPDMAAYFVSYGVLPDATARIATVSVLQAILLAMAVVFTARRIDPQLSRTGSAVMVAGVALVTLLAGRGNFWLYFYSTNNHFAALLFGLVGVGLILQIIRTPTWWRALLLLLVTLAAVVSTPVAVIAFVAPVGAAVVLGSLVLIWHRVALDQVLRPGGYIAGAVAGGYLIATVLSKAVVPETPFSSRLNVSWAGVENSVVTLVRALDWTVTGDTLATKLIVVLSCAAAVHVVILALRAVRIRRPSQQPAALSIDIGTRASSRRAVLIVVWLLAFIAPANLLGSLISGGLVDQYGIRYYHLPLALVMVLSALMLAKWVRRMPKRTAHLVSAATGGIVLVAVAAVYPAASDTSLASIYGGLVAEQNNSIAECLDDLRADGGLTLSAGISAYYDARGVQYQMDEPRLPIYSVWSDLSPFLNMATKGPLVNPTRYPAKINFAVLPPAAYTGGFNFTPENVGPSLPPGGATHACSDGTEVRVWEDDSLDRAVRAKSASLLTNPAS